MSELGMRVYFFTNFNKYKCKKQVKRKNNK